MGLALNVAIPQLPPPRTPTPRALVSYSTPLFSCAIVTMWKSISLDDSPDADIDWDVVDQGYAGPRTPSTISDHPEGDNDPRPQTYADTDDGSDEDYGGSTAVQPRKKKGGYDSRIEQILYENPDLPILIVDAGKSVESGGKYIVYTIRTGVSLQPLPLSYILISC